MLPRKNGSRAGEGEKARLRLKHTCIHESGREKERESEAKREENE